MNKECVRCKEILRFNIEARNDFTSDERYLHGLEDVICRRQQLPCTTPCTLVGEYRRTKERIKQTK